MTTQDPVVLPLSLYLRTNEGDTFHAESLVEALEILTGSTGYRLTVSDADGNSLVVRSCSEDWEDGPIPGDRVHGPCQTLTVRGLGPMGKTTLPRDPMDLFSPEERAAEAEVLGELQRRRQRAEVESADIPVG